jgi:cyclin M-like protein
MQLFYKVFYWPIRLLDWAGARTVRLFGLHPSSEHASVYTEDELRRLIEVSRKSGNLEEEEQKLINRVFDFSDAEVREAMIPRFNVAALPVTATLEEAKQTFRTHGYSRLPVYAKIWTRSLACSSDETWTPSWKVCPKLISIWKNWRIRLCSFRPHPGSERRSNRCRRRGAILLLW